MDIGKTVKIHTNIPETIPIRIPSKPITPGISTPQKTEKPIKVDNWPVRVPEKVEK